MNERWRYQIKTGSRFGILMALIFGFWESYTSSFEEAFLSLKFILKLVIFIVIGIFLIGYESWLNKLKKDKKR